ncbi:LysR family transcriptional regulator [Brucella cytisi]|uniref:LysR family transcriptional regulator n=1 Tax=Brucella cytisi TaxID=407152 RepID=A0A1J6HX91_9HYPH|nr:LysR family transcriptional regulator [Brucella cytisi]OIS92847.1 LysR family transcriptional regulator [Brucella cytisi]
MKSDLPDPSMLQTLCILVEERSVTKAAIRLNQSQPAISLVLGRLRQYFADQLLVRGREGMVPTDKAILLLPRIRAILSDMERLASVEDSFEPTSTRHVFTIASPDYVAPSFLAEIVATARREAPYASLIIRALGQDYDFESALARRDIDIVIGNWPSPPNYLRQLKLLQDDVVCLMRKDHPLASKAITASDYLAASHITPLSYSQSHRGVVESHLTSIRASRNQSVSISYFSTAPFLLINSDLVFSTSRHFASYFAEFLPLVIRESPIPFPKMTFYQLWHDRAHYSPEHRWLRDLIIRARNSLYR